MLNFTIGQLYDNNLHHKASIQRNVMVENQKHDQMLGIEQRKSYLKKKRRDRMERIEKNKTMTEIMGIARKNIAEGRIIKVGI